MKVDPHNFVLVLVLIVLIVLVLVVLIVLIVLVLVVLIVLVLLVLLVLLVVLVLLVLVLIVNSFKPFQVKSNDSNSIISLKSQFWVIFSHIGDLLTIVGPISTCANGGRWDSTIIGTVLDHLQPNQMMQIRSIVQKVTFGTFSAKLGIF